MAKLKWRGFPQRKGMVLSHHSPILEMTGKQDSIYPREQKNQSLEARATYQDNSRTLAGFAKKVSCPYSSGTGWKINQRRNGISLIDPPPRTPY